MADRPTSPTPGDDTGVGHGRGSRPSTPRWVWAFGISALVVALAVVFLFIFGPEQFGPGGGHGPGRHISSSGAGGQTPPATVTANYTPPSSGQEDTGGVGGPADADEAVRTIEVTTLDTMTLEPIMITVSAGETVTFVVTNSGQIVHEFTLGDAAMQQEHAMMMAHIPAGMAHDTPNTITLQPGETKHLTWRFGGTGTLEYACHEPGHYQSGMRGEITIN